MYYSMHSTLTTNDLGLHIESDSLLMQEEKSLETEKTKFGGGTMSDVNDLL